MEDLHGDNTFTFKKRKDITLNGVDRDLRVNTRGCSVVIHTCNSLCLATKSFGYALDSGKKDGEWSASKSLVICLNKW